MLGKQQKIVATIDDDCLASKGAAGSRHIDYAAIPFCRLKRFTCILYAQLLVLLLLANPVPEMSTTIHPKIQDKFKTIPEATGKRSCQLGERTEGIVLYTQNQAL